MCYQKSINALTLPIYSLSNFKGMSMEKIKANMFEGILVTVIGRSLVVGPNLCDALVVVGVLAAMAYKSFLSKDKDERLEAVNAEVAEIRNKIDLITMKMGITDARKVGPRG